MKKERNFHHLINLWDLLLTKMKIYEERTKFSPPDKFVGFVIDKDEKI